MGENQLKNVKMSNTSAALNLFTPFSHGVHYMASKCSNKGAKAVQALQYFAKPLDSIMQAVACPIFVIGSEMNAVARAKRRSLRLIDALIIIPFRLVGSIGKIIDRVISAALHILCPTATAIAVKHGKAASDMYFIAREALKRDNPKALDLLPNVKLKEENQQRALEMLKNKKISKSAFRTLVA